MDKFKKLVLKERIKSVIVIIAMALEISCIGFILVFWFKNDTLSFMGVLKEIWYIFVFMTILGIYLKTEDKIWRK